MPGLIRGVARTAVVAGTASAVAGRVNHHQQEKWATQSTQQQQAAAYQQMQQQAYYDQQAAYAAQQAAPQQVAAAPAAPAGLSMDEKIAQLEKLASLKSQGILSDAEFEVQKAAILSS